MGALEGSEKVRQPFDASRPGSVVGICPYSLPVVLAGITHVNLRFDASLNFL